MQHATKHAGKYDNEARPMYFSLIELTEMSSKSQEVGGTLIGEDGLMVMTADE